MQALISCSKGGVRCSDDFEKGFTMATIFSSGSAWLPSARVWRTPLPEKSTS